MSSAPPPPPREKRMLHDNNIHTPQYRALVCGALYMAFKDLGEVVEWPRCCSAASRATRCGSIT